ncbi:MAG: hypothetical protein K2K85_04775 [Clostridia bacterium]|nr:hypothetical protein [Clostridia bacterium]
MKKISIAIIAILCIMSMLIAFGACQKGGDEDTPSGQPSGNAPSGSVDSGEIPSGSIDSGDIDSGDTILSGSVDSGDAPSGDQQPELPSGSISSGDIGSGENPPEEEKPKYVESIRDLIENYSEIVYSALNDYYLESIGRECIGRTFNTSKVLSVSWDIGNSDKISKIDLIMIYENVNNYENIIVSSADFDSQINVKELKVEDIANVLQNKIDSTLYTSQYFFTYNTTIQFDRANLTKAICDKVFGENASATRYIVDNGYKVDNTLNEAREFKVVEITNTGIQEISIRIKDASTDEGYIANLENPSYYRTFDEKSYTLSGNKITQ